MAMLSPEINRFLGHVLLDPELLKHVFSGDRVVALKAYNLRPEVQATILASHARTLPELSRELVTSFAIPDMADAETQIERLGERLRAASKPNAVSVKTLVNLAMKSVSMHDKDDVAPTGTD